MVCAGVLQKEVFVPVSPFGLTPNAIAPSGRGTWYVSSVFDGNVAEYSSDGVFERHVVAAPLGPPLALPVGQVANSSTPLGAVSNVGAPLGIGVDSEGTLYYADIGILTVQPIRPGNVFRVRFDDGDPLPPEPLDSDGLAFPDGIGILELDVEVP